MSLSSLIMLNLNKMIGGIVCEVVMKCGEMKGFDGMEVIRSMNLDEMEVNVWSKSKSKSKSKSESESESEPKSEPKELKSKVPMPFNGCLKDNCCLALRQNHGLYTQCETVVSNSDFCKKCGPSAIYGTIKERLEMGIMEYRDPKGKAPTPFVKVMKKLKISREEVEEEAGKQNITINDIHFQEEEKIEKKEKGRPKKPKRTIELADDSTDLFAALVAKANEECEESDDDISSIAENIIESVLDNVSIIAENNEKKAEKESVKQAEKEKKDAAKLAEKEAAKLALIQKKESEKAEKEAAKLAEIQKKESEKAEKEAAKLAEIQKKELEKAEKEAAKLAEIKKKESDEALKQAEKEKKESEKALKQAEKEKKESEKLSPPATKVTKTKKESEKLPTPVTKVTKEKKETVDKVAVKKSAVKEVEEPEEDVVKRFEFEGVKYLKSKKTGIIYNMDQDVIGKWNEKTNKIDFEEAGSEEEEDEYDE